MKPCEFSFRVGPTAEVFNEVMRKLIGALRDTEQFGVAAWRVERHRGERMGEVVPLERKQLPPPPYHTTLHNTTQLANAAV